MSAVLEDKIKHLEKAKQTTQACLNDSNVLVDMHGLAYWAGEVERLRKEIRERL